MQYAIQPSAMPALPLADSGTLVPVNRIFCVGRNYAAHVREMGFDPDREPPFFFMKPSNATVVAGKEECSISYPPKTENLQYEIELVAVIGKGGANIPVGKALEHVYGYCVGLDMTRRDLQIAARDRGRPWEFGKSFAESAPMGPVYRVSDVGHLDNADIWLKVNGETRQSSNTNKLIWSVAECIAYLSEYDALQPGDVIMTGTPEGVGAVKPGDLMVGGVAGLAEIAVRIAK